VSKLKYNWMRQELEARTKLELLSLEDRGELLSDLLVLLGNGLPNDEIVKVLMDAQETIKRSLQ
jgi:hypothetical protein